MNRNIRIKLLPLLIAASLALAACNPETARPAPTKADPWAAENLTTKESFARISDEMTFGYWHDGVSGASEGACGFRLRTDGSTVSYTPYIHKIVQEGCPEITLSDTAKLAEWALPSQTAPGYTWMDIGDLGKALPGKTYSIDASDLADGDYCIYAEFNYPDNRDDTVHATFRVKDGTAKCYENTSFTDFQEFMSGTDPRKCLDVSECAYPSVVRRDYHAADDLCAIVDGLMNLEGTSLLVTEGDTDEYRMFVITRWISKNCAYDGWVCGNFLKGDQWIHRAGRYDDWDNPKLWLPYTKTGVCWDFANALTIMLRHAGIPATTIEDGGSHMWTAAHVNGRWVSIDASKLVYKDSPSEDPDPSHWQGCKGQWRYFAGYRDGVTIGDQLWRYED
ncbi:MAG: transglutaminase-like domain-containing protein [Lachnospiraceae bacterium]|nr:transglutaminase-like domain-containing protein [Lachnospiraceae bacterium]